MAQAHFKPESAAYDDAMMRILVHLEALQKMAEAAGDEALAAQLKATFDESLQRYYDTKRAQLEAAIDAPAAPRQSRRAS